MTEELKGLTIRTMIGQLPGIINTNNNIIKNQFNEFYDSSNKILTKSVDTTKSTEDTNDFVKSHLGEFTNLVTSNIVVTSNAYDVSIFNHQNMNNRYGYSKDRENQGISGLMSVPKTASGSTATNMAKYCHNAHAIGVTIGDSANHSGTTYSLAYVLDQIINYLRILTEYTGLIYDPFNTALNDEGNINMNLWVEHFTDTSVWYNEDGTVMYETIIDPSTGEERQVKKVTNIEVDKNRILQ